IYAAAADSGVMALDLAGNEIWRQGMRGGGEPSDPVLSLDYVMVSLSDAGLYIMDKATGEVRQFFQPGNGSASPPTRARDRLFMMSKGGYLYGFLLRHF